MTRSCTRPCPRAWTTTRGWASRSRSAAGTCPPRARPCTATDIEPNGVDVEAYLNEERKQASNTKHFISPREDVVARISQVMTLLPGDLIATGTPSGIGPMQPGDRVEVRIEGIGSLKNSVVKL